MAGSVQPEVPNYDTGVYQLQLTDPVQGGPGGVSNAPLLNLANRTAWLYQELNLVIDGTTIPPTVAPLNSPVLTGTPTTPTPPLGDNSLKIANTAFVQGSLAGVLALSVAGGANVVLSAVQAGNGTFNFTGALTANIAVIVPGTPGKWVVQNNTTGPFTLTVKTAAGTGVAVSQGKAQSVFGDGTNVYLASNDFSSLQLTGTPTAPTPPVGDQSTKVATTNFAYQLKNGVVTVPVGGGSNVTLSPAQYGNGIILLTGALTAAIEVVLPQQGGTYVFANETTGAFGLTLGTAAAGATTSVIPQGQSVVAYCDGTNVVLAGAAASSSFRVYTFTAMAGQSDFACPYTPGNILVAQNGSTIGSANYVATDGANVVLNSGAALNDEIQVIAFSSFTVANALTLSGGTMIGPIMLAGGDTGVTAPQFDNSTKLATTEFVQRTLGNFQGLVSVNGAMTLTALQSGSFFEVGKSGYTITLPAATTQNLSFTFYNSGASSTVTLAALSGVIYSGGVSAATYTLTTGNSVQMVSDGSNWIAIGGAGSAFLSGNGYQKLPSGLIIQWGIQSLTDGNGDTVVFPIAFPNNCLRIVATDAGAGCNPVAASPNGRTSFIAYGKPDGGTNYAPTSYQYIAFGY